MSLPSPTFPADTAAMHAELFAGGGEMGKKMQALDWARTSVGPVSTWPHSLRTAVRILLQCQLPMYIAWGPENTQFFNDAYRPILGNKQDGALGASAQATWPEIWNVIGPMWAKVRSGEAFGFDNFKLTIDRYGYSEDCYFNYSYSGVPDDDGNTAGVLVTFVETTSKVLAERRHAFLLELAQQLRALTDPLEIMQRACETFGAHLGASRVGYAEVNAGGALRVERDWTDGSVASLARQTFDLDAFGSSIAGSLRNGAAIRIDDVGADPRSQPVTAAYASAAVAAVLTVPMMESGRLSAVLYVHQREARYWSDDDLVLATDMAELTWDVVMRARAQRERQESEEHFRNTVALNPDVQWTANPDGQIDRVAPRWEEWTGLPGNAFGWTDPVHPDDLAQVMKTWQLATSSGTPYDAECRVRMRDGHYAWVRARAFPQRDSAGAVIKWYGTSQLIDAYKHALAQVDKRDEDFRTLAEAMPNQAWIADQSGHLYWFNQRVYEYSGCAEGTLDGEAWASMVHPDDLAHTIEKWSAALASTTAYENEFRLRDASTGEYRWFIARALPVLDRVNGSVRWIGTNTDVHEQKASAAKLAVLNANLEDQVATRTADRDRMWRLSTDIMLVATFDATIVAINPAWETMLGWTEENLLGTAFLDLVHPDDLQGTLDEAGSLSRGVKTLHFENRYRHSDGSYRWLAWTAVPDATYIHAVARDVTREKEQRLALDKAEQALRQAQKLESVGKLTGGVAHDFNNILQVISGSIQLLQNHPDLTPGAGERLATAMRAVDRGARLASHLLAFARRQPLQPTVIQPDVMLDGIDDLLQRALGETIKVQTSACDNCWQMMVDQHQLENVLLNLAINARDAMPDGGHLTLEVSNATLDPAYASRHPDLTPGQYVMFAVTDTGTGMTAEVLEQACEPFFTTKKEGEGTGLGLSMAYGFVKQSGGHFRIYSEPGHGTTIKLYFPRSEAEVTERAALNDAPLVGGSETILVVEDDADVQATVIALLKALGYKVLKANDAQAALSILESGVSVDLLFSDVVMPGPLRSPDLARRAKLIHPEMEVLFTSGYPQDAMLHGGRMEEGVELLSKPYSREQLARKLRHVFANGQQKRVPVSKPRIAAPGTARRILVVEDMIESQELLCQLLELLGHQASGADDAESALLAFDAGDFDVLLTDYTLPGMNGVQLADLLKARRPELDVIFLTGLGGALDTPPRYEHVLLTKPCDMTKLAEVIG